MDDQMETSVDNLQAREFWKEQHEQDQKQGVQRSARPKSAVQNYQRELSSSKLRRQPQTARATTAMERDPDDLGPATFVNSAHVRKDHRYYRRKGALWTDPEVHVPESRQHLLGLRPDLDKKHNDYVQSVVAKEKRAAQRILNHRAHQRYETQTLLRQRQEENLVAEETALNWGTSRQSDITNSNAQSSSGLSRPTTAARTRQGVLKKDWKFYRRQGALWTDLVHLPPERLHFVLRPKIVKMDREATMRIKERYEEEIDREYASRETKMRRANKIRNAFLESTQRRRERIKNQWGREPPFSLGKTGTDHAQQQQQQQQRRRPRSENSRRIAELAQPKTASKKRPSTSVGQSYYGLLSADTTVGPLLHEHWGRQGYDIHQSGKINVTDSITSTDEVRVNVTATARAIATSRLTGGRRGNSSRSGIRANTPVGGRASTTRGRQRQRPSASFTKSQRPSTAPNAGFTGSQTGGYQGARADPYDGSRVTRSSGGGGGGGGGGSVLVENETQQQHHAEQVHSTEFTVEMTPASASVVDGPAQDALEAIMTLDLFDARRIQEEKAKGHRHENWFSKPYIRSTKRIQRPSTAGAVSKPLNYFRDMDDDVKMND